MANIEKRYSKTGIPSYRVQVRLKGHPIQSATFKRMTEAKRWEQVEIEMWRTPVLGQ